MQVTRRKSQAGRWSLPFRYDVGAPFAPSSPRNLARLQ